MSNSHEKIIINAVASMKMEGFVVTNEWIDLCQKLLDKEITMAEYIDKIKKTQGIVA